ncbi:hypothetical protein F2Q68_00024132 [Brassica cretica]|uniref:Uncharacterized protein n=1 Tax=Brassica cretica TaxID=69181 RepID=A0A8S9IDL1_BRACR|nr:hypothetical protein F2Q68_00024132 [Brassica cretica]
MAPDRITVTQEHQERNKLNLLLTAEAKFYKQRSRVRWGVVGDRNTTFYHKTVSQRVARNHIHFLRDEDDHMISSTVDIKAHSASYFEDIIGKTDLPVSPASLECLQNLLPFRCTDMQ